jgi:hypothetical protein
MRFTSCVLASTAAIGLISLAACTLNTAPPVVAAPSSPPPVVVQQPPPSGGAVVVQPRSY